jgi:hypothetical protein
MLYWPVHSSVLYYGLYIQRVAEYSVGTKTSYSTYVSAREDTMYTAPCVMHSWHVIELKISAITVRRIL